MEGGRADDGGMPGSKKESRDFSFPDAAERSCYSPWRLLSLSLSLSLSA